MRHGPHLSLSPWAFGHLTVEDAAALHVRAAALDAHVTAVHSRGGWTVHATQGRVRASVYHAHGSLASAIGAVLVGFEAERDRILAAAVERFTPDELVTLADQTEASHA